MKIEVLKKLHDAIEKEDLEVVRRLVEDYPQERYFYYDEKSALFKALSNKRYDVASYLVHIGAKITANEDREVYNLNVDKTRLNLLLSRYHRKSHKSCIFRLLSCSQSSSSLDGDNLQALKNMYEDLFKSEIIKSLMMVLEKEDFDIVFDFSSEDINRIYRYDVGEQKIYGLTLSESKEIHIGAMNLLSNDPRMRAKTYGVVAEEFCHLALTTIFENYAEPYKEEDQETRQNFKQIVEAVHSLVFRSCHVESVVKDVFTNYPRESWECELIARVPHVIGIYGEESGRNILKESSELSRLLLFYDQEVLTKCQMYVDPMENTKAHRMMAQLTKKNEFISFKEKQIQPLKEDFPSFKKFLVEYEGIFVITTNCIKLCTLQIFHELRRKYKGNLKRNCLFFSRQCIQSERDEIRNALKGNVWEYLIVVMDGRTWNLRSFMRECQNYYKEFIAKGMKVIIISDSQSLGSHFQKQTINYEWKNLTDEYKEFLRPEYTFKGKMYTVPVYVKDIPKTFSSAEILKIMGGDLLVLNDYSEEDSQFYTPETYVKREFRTATLDKTFLEKLPENIAVFIYGICRFQLQEMCIDENLVQWLEKKEDEIQSDKSVFVVPYKSIMTFEYFLTKIKGKTTSVCLYYENKMFHVRNCDSLGAYLKRHVKEITLSEEDAIDVVKRNKVLIISDNAGCGKTTVTSSLVRILNEAVYNSWVLRVDLRKFSMKKSNSNLGGSVDTEDVTYDDIFLMLGLENGLEISCFMDLYPELNCFVFLDGLDEVPSQIINRTMRTITFLRKTNAKIIITTRKHLQRDLEESFNTYSHQLLPLQDFKKVDFLGKLWRWKLKYPHGKRELPLQRDKEDILRKIKSINQELNKGLTHFDYKNLVMVLENIEGTLQKEDCVESIESARSEIDNLDLSALGETILKETSLDEKFMEFVGVPLHLYMSGTIHLNHNFNGEMKLDIHDLYSYFIEQKIQIYLEEKLGIPHYSNAMDKLVIESREDTYRIHYLLAVKLKEEGKIKFESSMNKEDRKFCSALGIVYINGEEVNFIHQTFAEFIISECVRKEIRKDMFLKVISDDNYVVVRAFLSSALEKNQDRKGALTKENDTECDVEKKHIGNLCKEYFEDITFLINVTEKVIVLCSGWNYDLVRNVNSDMMCIFNIMRFLIRNFEEIDDNDVFVKKFFKSLIENVESIHSDGETSIIGAYLTEKMLKNLLIMNFKMHSKKLLFFLKFSKNAEVVINLMEECIFILKSNDEGTSKSNHREDGAILELSSIKNKDEIGLFYYAAFNDNSDILISILKFFKSKMDETLFRRKIIEGREYNAQMNEFVRYAEPERVFKMLRDMMNKFENETEIFFSNDLTLKTAHKLASEIDTSRHAPKEIIHVLYNCLGNVGLLMLFRESKTHSIDILNLIKEYFKDKDDEMKSFLRCSNKFSSTIIFHFAASKRDLYFKDIMEIYKIYLEEDEICNLLIKCATLCRNVIHCLFWFNSSETLKDNIKSIKEMLNNEDNFKRLIMSKDEYSEDIFIIWLEMKMK